MARCPDCGSKTQVLSKWTTAEGYNTLEECLGCGTFWEATHDHEGILLEVKFSS